MFCKQLFLQSINRSTEHISVLEFNTYLIEVVFDMKAKIHACWYSYTYPKLPNLNAANVL